ncbi:MAG: hypothetical protein ACK5WV_11530, partial [Chryseotalea sp.]
MAKLSFSQKQDYFLDKPQARQDDWHYLVVFWNLIKIEKEGPEFSKKTIFSPCFNFIYSST